MAKFKGYQGAGMGGKRDLNFRVYARFNKIKEKAAKNDQLTRALLHNIGNALSDAFKQNFHELNYKKSKYGHNFYTREGESRTDYEVAQNLKGGTIVVRSYQMAHALRGGKVSAKNVKYLSIPVSEQAKRAQGGARTSGIANLSFIPRRGKSPLLATVEPYRKGQGKRSIVVHYVLKKSVVHKPRPYVIPSQRMLSDALAYGIKQSEPFF